MKTIKHILNYILLAIMLAGWKLFINIRKSIT